MKGYKYMKLNYEALRAAMIQLQKEPMYPNMHDVIQNTINDGNFEPEDVQYAIKQAIDEGLLDGKNVNSLGDLPFPMVFDITPYGHKFIDSIADSSPWNIVKNELATNGIPVTIPSISRVVSKLFFDE